MKTIILKSFLIAVFSIFAATSANAQEEIKPLVEVNADTAKKACKPGCEKACCVKSDQKAACKPGCEKACCAKTEAKKSCCASKKEGKKSCAKAEKKSCSKDKKKCTKGDKVPTES